jgi:hypothetical protein
MDSFAKLPVCATASPFQSQILLAKPARSKRMPLLVSGSRSVLSVLTGDAKVVNVQAILARGVKPVRQIKPPERRGDHRRYQSDRKIRRQAWSRKAVASQSGRVINRLEAVEFEGNIGRGARGHEPALRQTHAETSDPQGEFSSSVRYGMTSRKANCRLTGSFCTGGAGCDSPAPSPECLPRRLAHARQDAGRPATCSLQPIGVRAGRQSRKLGSWFPSNVHATPPSVRYQRIIGSAAAYT